MKNNNHFSTNEASNSNKRRIDASKFYQTKLNFKIQKLNSNLNTIASVPNLKADVPLKTPVKPLKKQPKKFVETKKKIQKPTKKTYKKIDYKSVSKKGKFIVIKLRVTFELFFNFFDFQTMN